MRKERGLVFESETAGETEREGVEVIAHWGLGVVLKRRHVGGLTELEPEEEGGKNRDEVQGQFHPREEVALAS